MIDQKIPFVHSPPSATYYNVPNGRLVREFVCRSAILEKIELAFSFKQGYGPHIVILRGIGGQGKTQIALGISLSCKSFAILKRCIIALISCFFSFYLTLLFDGANWEFLQFSVREFNSKIPKKKKKLRQSAKRLPKCTTH